MLKILVVCLGNICRSPAGEAALVEAANAAGLDLTVDSAGTGPWHVGNPPNRQVVAAGRRAGLHVDGRGRQVTHGDELDEYDLVLAMDTSILAVLRAMAPTTPIRLFAEFAPGVDDDVPDPYGYPDAAFDETVRLVRTGAAAIVEEIQAKRLP